jgi:hypothetical protein
MGQSPSSQLFASEARRGRCGFGQAQMKANPNMRFYDEYDLRLVQYAPLALCWSKPQFLNIRFWRLRPQQQ